ncbi:MAG TPA: hypothetical protein VJS17_05740 [Pyrinomonadaceae bacterium]|nr:hypothetical protein [Pyrinomonadaceae bacterium]
MSDDDLQLLITLDDPGYAPEEDTFSHLQAHNLGYWLGRQYPTPGGFDQSSVRDNSMVTFGEGEWTCTVSRMTNVALCTVTHAKNGEIVERKMFYEVV